jgi:anti-sigma regulatory factor (Ser/Thr protein kinase)
VSAYYPLVQILLSSFNAILFVLLSYLTLRDSRPRNSRWGGYLYPGIVVALAVLFSTNLANQFAAGLLGRGLAWLYVLETIPKFLIPPAVFHLFCRNGKEYLSAPLIWRWCIAGFYAVSIVLGIGAVNTAANGWFQGYPGWRVVETLGRVLMVCAAAGSGVALWASRGPKMGVLYRNQRRWLLSACVLWFSVFLFEDVLPKDFAAALEKIPALVFIFVVTYYVERFTFFDVLIKKGAFVFSSLLLLTLYFVFVPPLLLRFRFSTWIGSLAWALSVWPIVLLAPWGHRKLSAWLDRRCLGRRFSPAAATKYFLNGLQGVISEGELSRIAQEHIEAIFRSRAEVSLGPPSPGPDCRVDLMTAPIQVSGEAAGEIRIYPREAEIRFLSEDMTLLASLADSLAFLLENLRLREKGIEQQKRERELRLDANRSELKALRAQVNPHFLFNALNTIAGLIPNHPGRAEEAVEELAEVFRYTLRGSEREWVKLEEELEAVRAYLRVEQARFAESLEFRIQAGPGALDVRIPSMIIQTLVENAVKHGIAELTTPGIVEIRADVVDSRLRIEVRDNGPGFGEAAMREPKAGEGGHGLRSVRDRLRGHFGAAANFSIGREAAREVTLVSIEIPLAAAAATTTP